MPFTDAIKDEARRRARYRCCRCHEIGIDVHHIIPEADGGPDTIDNAAPLCQNCHDRFGDNPRKRKEIRGMRDLWYEIAKEKWPTADDRSERLNAAVLRSETANADDLAEIASGLRAEVDRLKTLLDFPTPTAIREVATGITTPADVAVRVHEAVFLNDPNQRPYYFVNILNASLDREITVTHVWFETDPPKHVLTRLPGMVPAQSKWETWIKAAALPPTSTDRRLLARVKLADDTVISSVPRRDVPPVGYVPGS